MLLTLFGKLSTYKIKFERIISPQILGAYPPTRNTASTPKATSKANRIVKPQPLIPMNGPQVAHTEPDGPRVGFTKGLSRELSRRFVNTGGVRGGAEVGSNR
mgnify:CR=1 FL=1